MNIKVFEKAEIHPKAIVLLRKLGNVFDESDNSSLVDAIVVRTYTKVTDEFLKKYPNVRFVVRVGVGLDTIDIAACKKRDIQIIHSPGSNANAVSELVVLQALLLKRKLFDQIDSLKKNTWRDRTKIGTEIAGNTIGIIGCGAIGQLVARKFAGFDTGKIIGFDPSFTDEELNNFSIVKTSLSEIYKTADIITLHVPLTPETRDMITLSEFKLMKKNCILINTSRGGIVNEQDLIQALHQKLIRGAALDVFENEPEINRQLLNLDNLILTPHIGALTEEAEEAMSVEAVEKFISVAA